MTTADPGAKARTDAWIERVSAIVIGTIAVLAAVLAVEQAANGYAGDRAQQQASRRTADISAKISATSLEFAFEPRAIQDAIVLGLEGTNRELAALPVGDDAQSAIGAAQVSASDRLSAAVSESAGTITDAAVDTYARGLLAATVADLTADVAEQNRQVDLASAAGERSGRAVLGLSFAALAGVLVGLAAVLRAGSAGWIILTAAIAMTLLAGLAAITVVTG